MNWWMRLGAHRREGSLDDPLTHAPTRDAITQYFDIASHRRDGERLDLRAFGLPGI